MFALAPYEWASRDGLPTAWVPPLASQGGIDLRTIGQMSTAGGTPGASLFAFERASDVPKGATILTDDPSGVLTRDAKDALAALCGQTIDATRLDDALFEMLTTKASVSGSSGPRPLIPTRRGLELECGSIRRTVAFDIADPVLAPKVLAVLREDFRAARADALSRGGDHHQKMLGWWMARYKTDDPTLFQPSDLPRTEPREPSTTYTDDFNAADSATLGADLTWADVNGDFQNLSNGGALNSNSAFLYAARAEHNLSTSDNYGQIDIVAMGGASRILGGACRFSSSAHTCYYYVFYPNTSRGFLGKRVAGVETHLTNAAVTLSAPEAWKAQAEGSTIKGFQAGVERLSWPDTAISSGVRGGVAAYQNGGTLLTMTFDNFEAGDLAAGGGIPPAMLMRNNLGADLMGGGMLR